MPTDNPQLKVTLSKESAASVKAAAHNAGQTVSQWIGALINQRLKSEQLPNEPIPAPGEIMRTRNPRKRK